MYKILVRLFLCLGMVAAAVANQVSYQGILTNAGGDSLLSGTYDFSFSIFSQETGGTARWTEAHADVSVENGVYAVILGSSTPLPDSIGTTNWLQISVETTVLTPRLPITSDFRAIEARSAENSDSVNHIAASTTPLPGHLYPLDNTGKFPEEVLPFSLDSIVAGQGLVGGIAEPGDMRDRRNTLDERLTINVGAGDGINVAEDQVSATLGTSISTAEIENDAVTSEKVLDNTLTTADISPSIVSSIDSVFNDGGNIDLIAGPNISIVPDDVNNTITFSATGGGGGYSAGRCIALNGTVINNTMTITDGDGCIDAEFDSTTCTYTLYNLMNLIGGNCIELDYNQGTCAWTISVDTTCVDSVFDTEVYAESFVVIGDGTVESPSAHLRSDGGLEIRDGNGNEMYFNPNATMSIIQGGELVGGFDANGEFFANSFMVIDPETGDTLSHLNHEGGLELYGETGVFLFNPNGTMSIIQEGNLVAGLDYNGELFGRSLMVIEPVSGDTLIHLTHEGVIEMLDSTGHGTYISREGIETGTQKGVSVITPDFNGIIGGFDFFDLPTSGVAAYPDGTFESYQHGALVAGIDSMGEMFAHSFYTRNANGDTIIHLTSGGQILINGVPVAGTEGDTIRRGSNGDSALFHGSGFDLWGEADTTKITTSGFNWWGSVDTLTMQPDTFLLGKRNNDAKVMLRSDGGLDSWRDTLKVAGIDINGEVFGQSFYTVGNAGDTIAHLDHAGNLSLPDGALITIGGVPIETGGGIGDSIHFVNGDFSVHIDANSISTGDESTGDFSQVRPEGISTENLDDGTGVRINPNGTWVAFQDDPEVPVAGLDDTGEIFAHSFEVREDAESPILAHLYSDNGAGKLTTGTVFASSTLYSSVINGNTQNSSDMTPNYIRTLRLINSIISSGWLFSSDGTLAQYVNGLVNMSTTPDGYWMFNMPLFIGPQAGFHYLYYNAGYNGMQVNGNFKVNGKLTTTGGVDPIIEELFLTDSQFEYEVGTVLIADPNSDKFVPCNAPYQTAVVGVVSPESEIDDKGYVLATILGAAAAFRDDGSRLEGIIKADAKYGAIHRGDLLTTSATPGYVMLAADPKIGTIVGKALESLDRGTGEIKVMVTLQ